ncbi:MAG: hypothetical protein IJB31_07195 [Akkermansia sp.]|nr:hypothetical protein [Akkermansia sp.]
MTPRKSMGELGARIICLMLGLYLLAQGIAFTILANLGTDAITSPALVASLTLGTGEGGMGYEFCSVGNMLICIHILLVLMQILLLRSKYQPVQLLQVLMGLLLGSLLNVCLNYTMKLPEPTYAMSIVYTLIGCVIGAFGIFTYVKADLVPLSAEGFCLALTRTFGWNFSLVKVGLDCSMILIAVVASLILLGEVAGVREGSLICAVSTGFIIGWFFKFFPYWDKMYAALRGESRSNETNNADCA